MRAWGGPGPVFGGSAEGDRPLSETASSVLRVVTATGGPTSAECFIEDDTGLPGLPDGVSPTEWQAALVASDTARHRHQKTSVLDVTALDLASGRALRAGWKRWRGMSATVWILLHGKRRSVLFYGTDPRFRGYAITMKSG